MKIYDDPIAHFKQLAKQITAEKKDNLKDFNISFKLGRKASLLIFILKLKDILLDMIKNFFL